MRRNALHSDLRIIDSRPAQDDGPLVGPCLHIEYGVLSGGCFPQLFCRVGVRVACFLITHKHYGHVIFDEVQLGHGPQGIERDGHAAFHIQDPWPIGNAMFLPKGACRGGSLGKHGVQMSDDHDVPGIRCCSLPRGQNMGCNSRVVQILHLEANGFQVVSNVCGNLFDSLRTVRAAVNVHQGF